MKLTYQTILLLRDPMTKTPKVVAPWEVPAYRSMYGDEAVQVLDGTLEYEVDELPDAQEEFTRMRALFGVEEETKQSHVDIVYGRGTEGVKALEAAIKASASSGDVEAAQSHADKALGFKPDKDTVEARKNAHVDQSFDPLETTAEVDPDRDAAAVAAKAVADAAAAAATRQGAPKSK